MTSGKDRMLNVMYWLNMNTTIAIGLDDLRKIVREEFQRAIADHDASKALLSSAELMSMFHISKPTLSRWKHEGKVCPVKTVGRKDLYRASDVAKLIG